MNVIIDNDHVMARCPYGSPEQDRLKEDLGMRWSRKARCWYHPATPAFLRDFDRAFPGFVAQERSEDRPSWRPSPYLMAHQLDAARIAQQHDRYLFADDTGTGKTLEGVEIIKQKGVKALVVCPLAIVENAWMKDLRKFAPEIKVANLWELKQSSSKTAVRAYEAQLKTCEVALINYERILTEHKKLIEHGFEMLMLDESSRAKNYKAKTTKSLIWFADYMKYVYLFSGTPAPNSEMEYWAQIRMIDRLLLGASYYAFRNRFFEQTGYGGYTWVPKPERKPELLSRIAQVSRTVRKEDVLDLPERTINVRSVYLSKPELDAYKQMERNLLVELADTEIVAANAAVKIMKLREATSGFMLNEQGWPVQTGKSKLNELQNLMEEIGNHQVLIWTHFHYEAEQIAELMKYMDITWRRVDGSVPKQTTKNESISEFIDGSVQVLIAHPQSIGHGVTLVNCNYAIYFSLSHSYELYYQSMDRIYRKGQRNACTYYLMAAKGTVDEAIINVLETKGSVAQQVFDWIKNQHNGGGFYDENSSN